MTNERFKAAPPWFSLNEQGRTVACASVSASAERVAIGNSDLSKSALLAPESARKLIGWLCRVTDYYPQSQSEPDDAPELTGNEQGTWRIGDRVVSEAEGKAAMRDALTEAPGEQPCRYLPDSMDPGLCAKCGGKRQSHQAPGEQQTRVQLLEAKLREIAGECATCRGTREVRSGTIHMGVAEKLSCEDCADIWEAIEGLQPEPSPPQIAAEPPTVFDDPSKQSMIGPEECATWLDAKYARHKESEDHAAALWLRWQARKIGELTELLRICEARAIPQSHPEPQVQPACDCWAKVNALIKSGPLQGNGCDETAQRNGLILAANTILQSPPLANPEHGK